MRLDPGERQLRRELRTLLPANKDDVAAIDAIAARGYPAIEPILLELIDWIRSDYWPVARPAQEFLASLGPQLAPQIEHVLGGGDESLQARVLREFVSTWPVDAVRPLAPGLSRIAIHGQWCGVDLIALSLLARHRLADPDWIAERLDMKRMQYERRLAEVAEIRRMLQRET